MEFFKDHTLKNNTFRPIIFSKSASTTAPLLPLFLTSLDATLFIIIYTYNLYLDWSLAILSFFKIFNGFRVQFRNFI